MLSECISCLSAYALENLKNIHEKYKASGKDELEELKAELFSVIEHERDFNMMFCTGAPDGTAYVCSSYENIFLITLDNCYMLMSDGRIFDGELNIEIKKWIEEDHVLFFDTFYIVRNETVHYFCYYGNEENFFVSKKVEETKRTFSDMNDIWLTEDW